MPGPIPTQQVPGVYHRRVGDIVVTDVVLKILFGVSNVTGQNDEARILQMD